MEEREKRKQKRQIYDKPKEVYEESAEGATIPPTVKVWLLGGCLMLVYLHSLAHCGQWGAS